MRWRDTSVKFEGHFGATPERPNFLFSQVPGESTELKRTLIFVIAYFN